MVSSVIANVFLCFVVGVICPIAFAYSQLSGLNYTCKKLIEERAKIHECCVSLLADYDKIFVFGSNLSDIENKEHLVSNMSDNDDLDSDELLRNIIDCRTEKLKLEEFKREDIVLKFWYNDNRKYILAIGLWL